jgi:hypothetical protein
MAKAHVQESRIYTQALAILRFIGIPPTKYIHEFYFAEITMSSQKADSV